MNKSIGILAIELATNWRLAHARFLKDMDAWQTQKYRTKDRCFSMLSEIETMRRIEAALEAASVGFEKVGIYFIEKTRKEYEEFYTSHLFSKIERDSLVK